MLPIKEVLLTISLSLVLAGCSFTQAGENNHPNGSVSELNPLISTPVTPKPTADLREIRANEAGKVMIQMYHVIGAPQEAVWMQTKENFRRDLQTLYEQGYTLIRLRDFVENRIDVPAGRTPLVMTFDDGTGGQFRYLINKDGKIEIDPDCAVGILLDFAKKHTEFGHTATFYVNDRLFEQKEYWEQN